ncbi:hypothetical protein J6590_084534 [Homalodisca vitripennis]|nr:hypothetical protein J6590_084534 [Homalodisca vitripennis]
MCFNLDSVVKIDTDEVEVVTTAAYIALSKRKSKIKRKKAYCVHKVFRARDEEREFHTLFRSLKDDPLYFVIFVSRSLPLPCPCRALAANRSPAADRPMCKSTINVKLAVKTLSDVVADPLGFLISKAFY